MWQNISTTIAWLADSGWWGAGIIIFAVVFQFLLAQWDTRRRRRLWAEWRAGLDEGYAELKKAADAIHVEGYKAGFRAGQQSFADSYARSQGWSLIVEKDEDDQEAKH